MTRKYWPTSPFVLALASALALGACTSSGGGGGGGDDAVTATPGKGKITIEWTDTGAESYTLEYTNASGSEASAPNQITISGTISNVESPYEHDYLIYGETYSYTVKAVDSAGNSSTVGSDSATPDRLPLDEIEYADEALEGCVNSTMGAGAENGGATFADQIQTLTGSMDCFSTANIVSLEGIQHLTSLTEVDFDSNGFGDLTPLAPLDLLVTLDLSSNPEIEDYAPLASLASLREAFASGSDITDVSSFASLTQLQALDLENNSIADVEPLASLTSLRTLDLSGNEIADASPLASLTGLQTLDLSGNAVTDYSMLAGVPGLTELDLRNSGLTTLTGLGLENLTALETLNLSSNDIVDVTLLAGLTALKTLELGFNAIVDPSPLASLVLLETLNLQYNAITGDSDSLEPLAALKTLALQGNATLVDLTFLSGLPAIETLYLNNTGITDVTPLASLLTLQWLEIQNNNINGATSDLGTMPALKYLNVNSNLDISNVSFLDELTAIETLLLTSYPAATELVDVTPLAGLPTLKTLDLRNNLVSDASALTSELLPLLTSLNLSSNNLADTSTLQNLTGLETLILGSDSLGNLNGLEYLTALKTLVLDTVAINSDDLGPLANLTALELLDLDNNAITTVTSLSGLTALETLRLTGNDISDVSPLADLVNLVSLFLNSNAVATGVADLVALSKASSISLSGNSATLPCDDLQTLISALPGAVSPSVPNAGTNCVNP